MDRKHWHLIHTELPVHHWGSCSELTLLKFKGGFLISVLSMLRLHRRFIAAKKGGKQVWVGNHKQKRNQGKCLYGKTVHVFDQSHKCCFGNQHITVWCWEETSLQVFPNCYNWTLQSQGQIPRNAEQTFFLKYNLAGNSAILVEWKNWVTDIWDLAKLLQTQNCQISTKRCCDMSLEYGNSRELLLYQKQQFPGKKVTLDPSTMVFNTSEAAVGDDGLDLPRILSDPTHCWSSRRDSLLQHEYWSKIHSNQ